jgi:hypothetical protein
MPAHVRKREVSSVAEQRSSSSLLRMDMRLPGRVKAEIRSGGPKGGRAVKEFVEKVFCEAAKALQRLSYFWYLCFSLVRET